MDPTVKLGNEIDEACLMFRNQLFRIFGISGGGEPGNPEVTYPFSVALEAVRKPGTKIWRKGWNGKGQFVFYQKSYPHGIPINENTAEATGYQVGKVMRFLPYLMIQTVDGSFVPWTASQTDILADDWMIA